MGKLLIELKNQLKTEYKQEAKDCITIYNKLKELNNNHVWESDWNILVKVQIIKQDSNYQRIHKLSSIGELVLKGINT